MRPSAVTTMGRRQCASKGAVWLRQEQMAELFGRERTVIGRYSLLACSAAQRSRNARAGFPAQYGADALAGGNQLVHIDTGFDAQAIE